MHSKKLIAAIITILVLFATSCRSSKEALKEELAVKVEQADSTSLKVLRETKLVTTPRATARQTLTPEQLGNLPVGGKYQARDGNATATVEKKADGKLEFTADCDSLTLLVENLTTEIYRLNKEKTEFKERVKEQKTIEVNRLTGWQWFQIWVGRIALVIISVFLAIKLIKRKLF